METTSLHIVPAYGAGKIDQMEGWAWHAFKHTNTLVGHYRTLRGREGFRSLRFFADFPFE